MSTSGQRLISGANDRYLTLGGDEIVRELGLPAGWEEIVIGVQLGFQDSVANISGSTLAIGLCTDENSSWNSGSRAHWFGIVEGHDGIGAWTRSASPYKYRTTTNTWRNVQVEDSAKTVAGVWVTTPYVPTYTIGESWFRGLLALRISKSGSSWTGSLGFEATGGVDLTLEDVWENAEHVLSASHALSSGAVVTENTGNVLTVDEGTYGSLDYFNLWWNKATPAMEVFGVTVKRLR